MPLVPLTLSQPLENLHSIAAKLSRNFKKMELKTVGDLLWYFPFRYDDLSRIKKVGEISGEEINSIRVTITKIKTFRSWKHKITITEIDAGDDSGQIKATWFRQKFVGKTLKAGDEIYLSGKPQLKKNIWQFAGPQYEKVKDRPLHSARLVPIYHLSGQITQKQLRFLIDQALKKARYDEDPLPANLLNEEKYPGQQEALQQIHFPESETDLNQAVARLKFQELLYLQLKYQLAKNDYQKQATYSIIADETDQDLLLKTLPFELTDGQKQALAEVLADLSKTSPMNRLIEGDVGSGKTIVALLATLATIGQGYQVALMAPTEILAEQHFKNALKILPAKYHATIGLYTHSQNVLGHQASASKKEILESIADGHCRLIIGTHSLIQEKVGFHKLALAVIDEQHRFGVKQRQKLRKKNTKQKAPHLLSLTATPIPRSLALTLYGDLDISLIREKPLGRQIVKTFLVPEKKRADAYKFILEKINLNQQVFVICPLIDESDKLGVKSVTKEYEKLKSKVFPQQEIRFLHGKLKTEEKSRIMADFKQNKFPILVSTSVIEVGVDIPGATLMLIESAERFGLSQLHQFRGRIGRNALESFCLLFTSDDSHLQKERLRALATNSDGFRLAELDLELRGAGEIFGTRQTGLMPLRIARLTDAELIKKSQDWARKLISDPKYKTQQQLQKILLQLKTDMHLE
ncbi:MAG: DNA helicase RecG [Parcubacteria group bacterium]|nr:MAG: DNA helicase RecG [Parcubacteria group bacterium]